MFAFLIWMAGVLCILSVLFVIYVFIKDFKTLKNKK
jgi:hypothetical protein